MNREAKVALMVLGGYLAGGVATCAHAFYLFNKTGHVPFEGLTPGAPVSVFLQTVALWPYALAVNLRG